MISILIPSIDRPLQLRACLRQLIATTIRHEVEIVVSLCVSDRASHSAVAAMPVIVTAGHEGYTGSCFAWNEALARADPNAIAYVMMGDDVWAHRSWLDFAMGGLAMLPDIGGVVGCNDLDPRTDTQERANHFLVTRPFVSEVLGGTPFMPCYRNYFFDIETCERARRAGRYIYAPLSILEHRHPHAHKARQDGVYLRSGQSFENDRQIYELRRAAGFPNDYDPVIPSDGPGLDLHLREASAPIRSRRELTR